MAFRLVFITSIQNYSIPIAHHPLSYTFPFIKQSTSCSGTQAYFDVHRRAPATVLCQRWSHLMHLNRKWLVFRCSQTISGNSIESCEINLDFWLAYLCFQRCFAASDSKFQYAFWITQGYTHPLIPFDFCYSRLPCIIQVQSRLCLANDSHKIEKYSLSLILFALRSLNRHQYSASTIKKADIMSWPLLS